MKIEHKVTIYPVGVNENSPTRFDLSIQVGNSRPISLAYFDSLNRAIDLKNGIDIAFDVANRILLEVKNVQI